MCHCRFLFVWKKEYLVRFPFPFSSTLSPRDGFSYISSRENSINSIDQSISQRKLLTCFPKYEYEYASRLQIKTKQNIHYEGVSGSDSIKNMPSAIMNNSSLECYGMVWYGMYGMTLFFAPFLECRRFPFSFCQERRHHFHKLVSGRTRHLLREPELRHKSR